MTKALLLLVVALLPALYFRFLVPASPLFRMTKSYLSTMTDPLLAEQ